MTSFWKPLTLASHEHGVPPLLVKYDFGLAIYTIQITDLTSLWSETLDRKQIVKRALNLETSIDPSEDASQMQLLLRHVRESLEGHGDTRVTVRGEGDSDKLVLSSSITLPSPLLPLEWPMHLVKANRATFTNQFVLPSLNICSAAKSQVTSLLKQLKEKDYVINRLTDRIQSEGGDLGKIFPGVPSSKAGAKHTTKQTAAKSVRGLADFDEKQWRSQFASSNDAGSMGLEPLISSVFHSGIVDLQEFSQPPREFAWWKKLVSEDGPSFKSKVKSPERSSTAKSPTTQPRVESGAGGSFQRQRTPPSLHNDTNRKDTQDVVDLRTFNQDHGDCTTDESHDDQDAGTSALSSKKNLGKRFGVAVRPNNRPRSPLSSPSTQGDVIKSKSRTPDVALNQPSPTASIDTIESLSKQRSFAESTVVKAEALGIVAAEPFESSSSAKPRRKLGKIGGKAQIDGSEIGGRERSQVRDDDGSVNKLVPKKSIPSIINSTEELLRIAGAGPAASQPDQRSPKQVSEHQANENRKRLQRELENGSRAGNKKKRKF